MRICVGEKKGACTRKKPGILRAISPGEATVSREENHSPVVGKVLPPLDDTTNALLLAKKKIKTLLGARSEEKGEDRRNGSACRRSPFGEPASLEDAGIEESRAVVYEREKKKREYRRTQSL